VNGRIVDFSDARVLDGDNFPSSMIIADPDTSGMGILIKRVDFSLQ
jgi:hypothetical protein